jgi:hypothetical protein
MRAAPPLRPIGAVLLLAMWLGPVGSVSAQLGSDGPVVSNSTVGYVDSAIPGDQVRFRFETAYDNTAPSRGEFFYARSPNFPRQRAESKVDYQEFSAYVEKALSEQVSVFGQVPYRFINPTVDQNANGFSDINFGVKWAFYRDDSTLFSFQLRGYAPTGNGDLGLGTSHFSLEPALLGFSQLTDQLRTEGEVRLLVPITSTPAVAGAVSGGSSDFASTVLRLGVGLSYDVYQGEQFTVTPVAEAVTWVFLNGKKTLDTLNGTGVDVSAAGDTVVNLKFGARFKWNDVGDLYVGYGRSVTGERLYRDIYRVELRFPF